MSQKRLEMGEEAWTEYQRQRKLKKAQDWQAKNAESYVMYKRNVKLQLIEYKGGKCEKCSYNKKCASAYDFHHKDPTQKDFSLGQRSCCFETAKKEVDKCMLLCCRCHAEIHDELYLESKQVTIDKLKNMAR